MLTQILIGLGLSTAIGGLAYWRRSLSGSGWLGAILVGTITFGLGGLSWGLLLITFFVTSSLLSRFQHRRKQQTAGAKFEKGDRRDFGQTMANGGIGALLALAFGLTEAPVLLAAFLGVMATVTADTWATELGTISRQPPRLITTWRIAERGTSGAISLAGSLAALAGATLIGLAAVVLHLLFDGVPAAATLAWMPLAAALSGLGGSMVDSLLGATLQASYCSRDGQITERMIARDGQPNRLVRGLPWLHNDMVNALSSIAGGLFAVLIYLLIS